MSDEKQYDEFAQAADATPPEDAAGRKRGVLHQKRDALAPSAAAVHEEMPDIQWQPPQTLDAPPPRPGMTQRWIRSQTGPDMDAKNWSRKMREGWVPRDPATLPREYADLPHSKITHGNGVQASVIAIEGLVLCEMPLARKRVRDAHYAAKAGALLQAVNSELDRTQSQGGIPIHRRAKTQVKIGPHADMPDPQDGDV